MNKKQLIRAITRIKPEAKRQGYGYPTRADLQAATTEELQFFWDTFTVILTDGIIREMQDKIDERQMKRELGLC